MEEENCCGLNHDPLNYRNVQWLGLMSLYIHYIYVYISIISHVYSIPTDGWISHNCQTLIFMQSIIYLGFKVSLMIDSPIQWQRTICYIAIGWIIDVWSCINYTRVFRSCIIFICLLYKHVVHLYLYSICYDATLGMLLINTNIIINIQM